MKFQGDIVILDPGYVFLDMKDMDKTDYGEDMKPLGFSQSYLYVEENPKFSQTYLTVHCEGKTTDLASNSGSFLIVYLSELRKYNPEFDRDLDASSYAIIKDFDGEINEENGRLIVKNK